MIPHMKAMKAITVTKTTTANRLMGAKLNLQTLGTIENVGTVGACGSDFRDITPR